MLYALEDTSDERGRWRRLVTGVVVASCLTALLTYTATTYAPARELMQRVVTMTFHVPPPPVKPDEMPVPPAPPPPPAPVEPKKAKPQPKKAEAPQEPKPDVSPDSAALAANQVGMDAQSFALGGSGAGFRVGNDQMGDPEARPTVSRPSEPIAPKGRPTKYLMAKPLDAGANAKSLYNQRARKLGLAGLMLIELDLDPRGQVRTARIRRGLERQFDHEVLSAVKRWSFEAPGRVRPGEVVPTMRLLRLRFALSAD